MASVDNGQIIGWKYSTPLQAEYLDTFLTGLSNEGLLSRPSFMINGSVTDKGASITINPFSILIEPNDKKQKAYRDEDGNFVSTRITKITFANPITLSIAPTTVAIGVSYSFSQPGQPPASEWYADVEILSPNDLLPDAEGNKFEGIIIATVQWYDYNNQHYMNISTSGADISDVLLKREGWDPECWLSLISPRRIVGDAGTGGFYNRLEVRKHNDTYYGYLSGNRGIVPLGFTEDGQQQITERPIYYEFYASSPYNPHGERGTMPRNFNGFSLRSDGLTPNQGVSPETEDVPNASDTLPITNQFGGVFAIVDARIPNSNASKAFTNALKIKPVKREIVNIFYENDTLFIQ